MKSKPKKGRTVAAGKQNRGGRPPVADADRRDTIVRVLTTAGEYEELQQAAKIARMSVSTWMRAVAMERAQALLAAEIEAARKRGE